jgi:hypothetical protein
MKEIKGNIKEDEQAAFELICERMGVDPNDAKGVGYFNRLIKLVSISGLIISFDYTQGDNGKFKVSNVPAATAKQEEVVDPPKKEYVAPDHLNKSDADTDEDPFAI